MISKGLKRLFSNLSPKHTTYFKGILGESRFIEDSNDRKQYTRCFQDQFGGEGSCVLLPKTTEEVSQLLKYCNENNIKVVPQSGNTSLVGGASPYKDEVVLSLSRMNQILNFNKSSGVLTCEAGLVLQTAQEFVGEHGFETPHNLGSKGSCQIGGNVSTQAGGTYYYNHGSIRNHILGLEVVLADGSILDMMSTISKDNTGPDLKQLFIGSEGTLGVVTKINLNCPRKDKERKVLFLKVNGYPNTYKINYAAQRLFKKDLTAIEFQDYWCYEAIDKYLSDTITIPIPLDQCKEDDNFMMIQISSNNEESLLEQVEQFYEEVEDLVDEMLLAETKAQEDTFWAIREFIAYACNKAGYVFMYDLSIQAEKIHEMVEEGRRIFGDRAKFVYAFGHIGDDMSHVDFCLNDGYDIEETKQLCEGKFFKWVNDNGGSISSEHGIGQVKTEYMRMIHGDVNYEMMRKVKLAFDPKNTLNPGKLIEDEEYRL